MWFRVVVASALAVGALTACSSGSPNGLSAGGAVSDRAACMKLARSGGAPPRSPLRRRFRRLAIQLGHSSSDSVIRTGVHDLAEGMARRDLALTNHTWDQVARECQRIGDWAVYH